MPAGRVYFSVEPAVPKVNAFDRDMFFNEEMWYNISKRFYENNGGGVCTI